MANRIREPTKAEMAFAMRVAAGALVGFFDPVQFEKDKKRHDKGTYSQNLKDRARLRGKIGANYDSRVNAIGYGCRIATDNEANEAAIAEKERSLGIDSTDQDKNDEFDRDAADRKHAEKIRREKAKLAKLEGGSIDLGGDAEDDQDAQMDKEQDPESEYEDFVEYESPKKIAKKSVSEEETKHERPKQIAKNTPLSDKKGKEKAPEESKSISTKTKPPGFLASFFGLRTEEKPENDHIRMQKIARLAHHVRKLAPDYVFNEEEDAALLCLRAFPDWLRAPYTPEESHQIMQAALKQRD